MSPIWTGTEYLDSQTGKTFDFQNNTHAYHNRTDTPASLKDDWDIKKWKMTYKFKGDTRKDLKYGYTKNKKDNHKHPGVDRVKPDGQTLGTPLLPIDSGIVHRVVRDGAGTGNMVEIKDENGDIRSYQHLHYIPDWVKPDEPITSDMVIGTAGGTGGVPPHIHYDKKTKNKSNNDLEIKWDKDSKKTFIYTDPDKEKE